MDPFRRPSICRCGRWYARGRRRRGDRGFRVATLIGDAPNSSMHVVRDKERAIWSDNETRRPERCTTGIFLGASKAVGKDDVGPVCLAIGEWLEQDVVASLRPGGSIPGAVERDEGTALIGFWEGLAEIELQIVGRPMSRKERDRPLPLATDANLLAAIAAVLRPEHQFSLCVVEIPSGPAIIRTLPQFDNLFSRQVLALPS